MSPTECKYIISFFIVITITLITFSCSKTIPIPKDEIKKIKPTNISSGACIDIHGIVLGDIIPYSNVSLYGAPNLNFTLIMKFIRKTSPIQSTTVNESRGFGFRCIPIGKYVAVIPSTSFNLSVGSPLPYEFDCKNLTLRIAFQGGDYNYLIGAFILEDYTMINRSECVKNPYLCKVERGRFYIKCPSGFT